ncbi:MAG: tRNA (5-methylaminomethyl-2-thiouridine)(34)-methyltransferase MnmD [Bacteroidetes bacterium]|nr:tRNA (5-methylaminomethyl-2-thiouridine)(34)-methyltransferase MnmD [Bacteroidota bacterium]
MKPQFITTSDGSHTIYLPEMDEQYHSVNGAVTESNYVYIDKGYLFHESKTPKIFEVGFGTGLNCLLTALMAEQQKRPTTFYSIEKYPLKKEITDQLNYGELISEEAQTLFKNIHDCSWNKTVEISKYFKLIKLNADLLNIELNHTESCDIVYFDAFGPDKQPEMWQPEVLKKIYTFTSAEGVFVTYSAKGVVRRQLTTCGFEMERLPGPPGKIHMLRGIKKDSAILLQKK